VFIALKVVFELYFSCFSYFSALLGTGYKEYVRNFAAESFAFLMRKVRILYLK